MAHTDTHFAPAARDDTEQIREQHISIKESEFLDRVLARSPFMFFILNDKRQVVYSNYHLMKHLGFEKMEEMTGFRPGELFNCIHADAHPGGCGTAEHCRYCGAVGAVLESRKAGDLVTREAVINLRSGSREVAAVYEVSSRPFEWTGKEYFIVTMRDIAAIKRKEQLERTFIHDLKNKAGTIGGFLNLVRQRKEEGDLSNYLDFAERGLSELLEDIEYQRQLMRAESGDLKIHPEEVHVGTVIQHVCEDFTEMASRMGIAIEQETDGEGCVIHTDPVLLKRILGNLIKNAIEASQAEDSVTVGFQIDQPYLELTVKNPAVVPDEIKFQIFNKTFSTKGTGRGIGTYSIKLFTEEYLNGSVTFRSEKPEGTVFTVRLPLCQPGEA